MQVGLGNRQTENSYTVRRADNLNNWVLSYRKKLRFRRKVSLKLYR